MRLGNDTSHEIFADNFARNRGKNFVQTNSKKWLRHFFDSLKGGRKGRPFDLYSCRDRPEGGFRPPNCQLSIVNSPFAEANS